MSDKKLTLGQAIDQIVAALESLDENARGTALSAACDLLKITPNVGLHGGSKQQNLEASGTQVISPFH